MAKNKLLNITEIEDGLTKLAKSSEADFVTHFLSFYDIPRASINRGKKNFDNGEPFTIKNKLHYEEIEGDVVLAIDSIQEAIKHQKSKPRYIIVNDLTEIAALDTKTGDTFHVPLSEFPAHADFFLAWNGIEKAEYQAENPADRKAAERFAKLYDVVAKDNPTAQEHAFNLFLIRVLFLLFAEDTGIMEKSIFTNVLKTRTLEDGSNFNEVIRDLFTILDIHEMKREEVADWLRPFPYVNGHLFGEPHVDLQFSATARKLLIEAGELLDWNEINPDILGAMIQSVASEEARHVAGMHYTSVPNIMKVIKPLFLDELTAIYDDIKQRAEENEDKEITERTRKDNRKKYLEELNGLLTRISGIMCFDPACGSGNFLIISYKEIRRLEIKILTLMDTIEQSDKLPLSSIHLSNFYGIELDNFAHEVAKLSLWIAEHQMNKEMTDALPGAIAQLLPLKDAGNIVCGNSLRLDWDEVVPHTAEDEVYIMGNPPYLGSMMQNKQQKEELADVLGDAFNSKNVDYITGWFYKGAQFIANTNNQLAFVSTNSITQGEQTSLIWKTLLQLTKISFAYTSFKWENSAKGNAGVTVIIVGLRSHHLQKDCDLYIDNARLTVSEINAYLAAAPNVLVTTRPTSLANFPQMYLGSMPRDGGHLILNEQEYTELLARYPNNIPLRRTIKKYMGSEEFINGFHRYVLWFETEQEYLALSEIPEIQERVSQVREMRLSSNASSTKIAAQKPYSFVQCGKRIAAFQEYRQTHQGSDAGLTQVVVPAVSSEKRKYVPMGYVDNNTVISNLSLVIYNAPLWLLALLESRMHMVWLRSIGGKLKTDYRYSATLVYNTFPIQNLSSHRKKEMERVMTEILDLREYEGGTLAELYNTATMPESLKQKHEELDGIVDRAYQQRPFESDEERLATLLTLYQEMTAHDE